MACIILHLFYQDNELEVDQIWLNKGQAFDQEDNRATHPLQRERVCGAIRIREVSCLSMRCCTTYYRL